jgi:hypothetical protein
MTLMVRLNNIPPSPFKGGAYLLHDCKIARLHDKFFALCAPYSCYFNNIAKIFYFSDLSYS